MSLFNRIVVLILLSCVLGTVWGMLSIWFYNQTGNWNPALETMSLEDFRKTLIVTDARVKAFLPVDTFDFGVYDQNQEGKHDFEIENHGEADLTLQVNRTSCTCTGVDLSRDRIPPGEKGIITVHWKSDVSWKSGVPSPTFRQGASILTNDPQKPEFFLTVKGLFMAPVMIMPGSLVFPPMNFGSNASGSFRVYGFEQKPLELKSIVYANHDHFEISQEPVERNESDFADPILQKATSVIQVNVNVKSGLPPGTFQERLLLQTNNEREPGLEYFLRGMIQAGGISISGKDYSVESGTLNLGKTLVSKPVLSNFVVRYTGVTSTEAMLKLQAVEPSFLKVDIRGLSQNDNGNQAAKTTPTFFCSVEAVSETPGTWGGADPENRGYIKFETGLHDLPTLQISVQLQIEETQN